MKLVRNVSIENFKSIRKLSFELGQVNVLIGANGSGKSNVLEAIALAAAESRGKADNEYLVPRGVRMTEPRFMRCALQGNQHDRIHMVVKEGPMPYVMSFNPDDNSSANFVNVLETAASPEVQNNPLLESLRQVMQALKSDEQPQFFRFVREKMALPDFLIYAPENSALRIFQSEGQILPLGSRGDGLFAHLKKLGGVGEGRGVAEIAAELALLDWFERLEVPRDLAPGERSMLIRDRYLAEGALFDQRSANEGFLFLLFYFTLMLSPETPSFFAIDNIETSLNPKLCTRAVRQLVKAAFDNNKQIIFSTHSPAVLDGLDLTNDEQRLFVTERRSDGGTRVRRVDPPKSIDGAAPMKLSEAFVGGFLGGLPKNF